MRTYERLCMAVLLPTVVIALTWVVYVAIHMGDVAPSSPLWIALFICILVMFVVGIGSAVYTQHKSPGRLE